MWWGKEDGLEEEGREGGRKVSLGRVEELRLQKKELSTCSLQPSQERPPTQ